MSFEIKSMKEALKDNAYPGRGIAVGLSQDGTKAMFAYFIMGRSENSRNRIFAEERGALKTQACDPSKMQDPSLIIYYPVKSVGKDVIVTNGDQTDTIEEILKAGNCFRHALRTRRFEPDSPNFTPRISAILHLGKGYSYEMSILKSADRSGTACNRFFYDYEPVAGTGHFLHTYVSDGDPLPSFEGEPELIAVPDDVKEFAKEIWHALDTENKISLYCRAYDLKTGAYESVLYNKYK